MTDATAPAAPPPTARPLLPLLRLAALATSLGTFAFLFVGDGWRPSNAFLVPDLALCLALVLAALTPGWRAVPALLLAFGLAAGVLGAAAMSYIVDGRFGPGATAGFAGALVAAALLLRLAWRGRP